MKVSIVLPLFDRQHLGWSALESALDQDVAREHYEVVAVVPSDCSEACESEEARALLARCDAVVRSERTAEALSNRLWLFNQGAEAARGDVLFFMEGHTLLRPDGCRSILSYFAANPGCQAAWAPRIDGSLTALGRLIDLGALRGEPARRSAGTFNMGAQSVVRRALFHALHRHVISYGALGETVLLERLRAQGVAIGVIGEPLAVHHNDYDLTRYEQFLEDWGEAYHDTFDVPIARAPGVTGLKGALFGLAKYLPIAALLLPVCKTIAVLSLRAAIGIFAASGIAALILWDLGARLTILAGFCRASRKRRRMAGEPAAAAPW